MCFEIDRESVSRARKTLGFSLPVTIKVNSAKKVVSGSHRIRDGRHIITVSKMQSLLEVNKTLWHEFQHALDAEKWLELREISPHISYRRIVGEDSAIEAERKYAYDWLIRECGSEKQTKQLHF